MNFNKKLAKEILGRNTHSVEKITDTEYFEITQYCNPSYRVHDLKLIELGIIWARERGFLITVCPYEFYNEYVGNDDDFKTWSAYINVREHENGMEYDKCFSGTNLKNVAVKALDWILDNAN